MSNANMSLVSETARLDRAKAQSPAPRQPPEASSGPGAFSALMQSMSDAAGQGASPSAPAQDAARLARQAATARPPHGSAAGTLTGAEAPPSEARAADMRAGGASDGRANGAAADRTRTKSSAGPEAASEATSADERLNADSSSNEEQARAAAAQEAPAVPGPWWPQNGQLPTQAPAGVGPEAEALSSSVGESVAMDGAAARGRPGRSATDLTGAAAESTASTRPGRTTLEAFGARSVAAGQARAGAASAEPPGGGLEIELEIGAAKALSAEAAAPGPGAAGPVGDGASFAALLQAAQGSSSTPSQAPALQEVPSAQATLAVPVDDPGFGDAVALTVARWSGEGVQQATLDLHPAELGPIQIRIDIQGKDAHISFAAAHARTRSLLDEAMPNLAAALQTDGLSLASTQVTDVVKTPEAPNTAGGFGGQSGARQGGEPSGGDPRSSARPPVDGDGRAAGPGGLRSAGVWRPADEASRPTGLLRTPGGRLGLDLYA